MAFYSLSEPFFLDPWPELYRLFHNSPIATLLVCALLAALVCLFLYELFWR